jgi:hypothetical protein
MPISPQVRETGRMEDEYGIRIFFGVDHGSVTVNNVQFPAASDEFTRHLSAAIEAARAQAGTECHGACCLTADRETEGERR